jgi:hypothetical protein
MGTSPKYERNQITDPLPGRSRPLVTPSRNLIGALDLDGLKALVWEAASTIVAPQERQLRDFLQWAEGQLDMLQHTTDDAELFARSLEIVGRLEAKLWETQ